MVCFLNLNHLPQRICIRRHLSLWVKTESLEPLGAFLAHVNLGFSSVKHIQAQQKGEREGPFPEWPTT